MYYDGIFCHEIAIAIIFLRAQEFIYFPENDIKININYFSFQEKSCNANFRDTD